MKINILHAPCTRNSNFSSGAVLVLWLLLFFLLFFPIFFSLATLNLIENGNEWLPNYYICVID